MKTTLRQERKKRGGEKVEIAKYRKHKWDFPSKRSKKNQARISKFLPLFYYFINISPNKLHKLVLWFNSHQDINRLTCRIKDPKFIPDAFQPFLSTTWQLVGTWSGISFQHEPYCEHLCSRVLVIITT